MNLNITASAEIDNKIAELQEQLEYLRKARDILMGGEANERKNYSRKYYISTSGSAVIRLTQRIRWAKIKQNRDVLAEIEKDVAEWVNQNPTEKEKIRMFEQKLAEARKVFQ